MSLSKFSVKGVSQYASNVIGKKELLTITTNYIEKLYEQDVYMKKEKNITDYVDYTIGKAFWYAYIANSIAVNIRYSENNPLVFDYDNFSEEDINEMAFLEDDTKYLLSQCCTDGNCFIPSTYLQLFDLILNDLAGYDKGVKEKIEDQKWNKRCAKINKYKEENDIPLNNLLGENTIYLSGFNYYRVTKVCVKSIVIKKIKRVDSDYDNKPIQFKEIEGEKEFRRKKLNNNNSFIDSYNIASIWQ